MAYIFGKCPKKEYLWAVAQYTIKKTSYLDTRSAFLPETLPCLCRNSCFAYVLTCGNEAILRMRYVTPALDRRSITAR